MSTIDQVQSRIEGWHRMLNHFDSLPDKPYRRNVAVYELVSYVNHTIACFTSENFYPIQIFIERARIYMKENPDENTEYYSKVESYFKDLELFLGDKASVTKL
jgi:hypothetical protein